jgi:hypothetical protein
MQAEYSTRALIEMDEIAAFIQKNSARSALRFLDAVEATAAHFPNSAPALKQMFLTCPICVFASFVNLKSTCCSTD